MQAVLSSVVIPFLHALIKKNIKIFLIYKEIQNGAVAKSYMRKGFLFLIYKEKRKYLIIYDEAVSHIWVYEYKSICNYSILNFLIYEENLNFFFIRVLSTDTVDLSTQQHTCFQNLNPSISLLESQKGV